MVPSSSCTRTHIPNPLAGPDSMTVPSATETIGVPMAFAMSTPLCEVPHRAPNPEGNRPWAGRTNLGARGAAAASATLRAFASDAACEAPACPVAGGTARTPVVAASSAGAAGGGGGGRGRGRAGGGQGQVGPRLAGRRVHVGHERVARRGDRARGDGGDGEAAGQGSRTAATAGGGVAVRSAGAGARG